jgi:hypothetical protein
MASNYAVCIYRRSNTQFSAEEIPSGGLSFVRLVSTMSVYGTTFPTYRGGRLMSVDRGRPEVAGTRSKSRV